MCNREISSRRIDCFFPPSSTTIRGRSPRGGRTNPPPPPLAKVAKYGKRARVNPCAYSVFCHLRQWRFFYWLIDTYFIYVDTYKNITQNGLAQKRFTAYNKAPLLSLARNSAQGQGRDRVPPPQPQKRSRPPPARGVGTTPLAIGPWLS